MAFKEFLNKHLLQLEDKFDDFFSALKTRLGLNDPIQIVPYRTYGTTNRLFIKGRVLQDKLLKSSTSQDTIFTNLVNMYKRFESDEVPHAVIRVKHQHKDHFITTDHEGYFELNISPDDIIDLNELWQTVELELHQAPFPVEGKSLASSEILIPPYDSEFGVISDIDDTIVQTSATNVLSMASTVFLRNAHTRLPFPGVSAFYRALQLGRNGKRNNPFFYVSSSPWNMYDLLREYMDLNDIPQGPLLLRDFGFNGLQFSGSGNHQDHKLKQIDNILTTYPLLNFVLIGDSGQDDPVIYKEVVKRFPGRVLAIYIRDVQNLRKEKAASAIAEEISLAGVDMLVIDTAKEAADHASEKGLILTEELPAIKVDKDMDTGVAPGKAEL